MTTTPVTDSTCVPIGSIVKARGLAGEVKVALYSGDPSELASYQTLYLERGGERQAYTVEKTRAQGKFGVVKLREIATRLAAEAQAGAEVLVMKSQMPPLAADEFYWHEMLGLAVRTTQGQELGTVTSLIATGGHDVLVVTGKDQEYLIPALKEVIVSQDNAAGVLLIDPIPGLLEMNASDEI